MHGVYVHEPPACRAHVSKLCTLDVGMTTGGLSGTAGSTYVAHENSRVLRTAESAARVRRNAACAAAHVLLDVRDAVEDGLGSRVAEYGLVAHVADLSLGQHNSPHSKRMRFGNRACSTHTATLLKHSLLLVMHVPCSLCLVHPARIQAMQVSGNFTVLAKEGDIVARVVDGAVPGNLTFWKREVLECEGQARKSGKKGEKLHFVCMVS